MPKKSRQENPEHSALIDALGGTKALAERLGVTAQRISAWRNRGISYAMRPRVARLAAAAGIELPKGFYD